MPLKNKRVQSLARKAIYEAAPVKTGGVSLQHLLILILVSEPFSKSSPSSWCAFSPPQVTPKLHQHHLRPASQET